MKIKIPSLMIISLIYGFSFMFSGQKTLDLNQENHKIKEEKKILECKLDSLANFIDSLAHEKTILEQEMELLKKELEEIRSKIGGANGTVDDMDGLIKKLKSDLQSCLLPVAEKEDNSLP